MAFPAERESSKGFLHTYQDITSVEHLLASWQEFLRGKRQRRDVAEFSIHFMDNILALHGELRTKTYQHGAYHAFKLNDPKPRDIHKATVRDRLVHHALYRSLLPYFDRHFIHDSYSCRKAKGTHRAINRFREFGRKVSRNNTRTCWVLKCDIKKFFANIDHGILKGILKRHIVDPDILWLLSRVIDSFRTYDGQDVGLPLGNLTSQLLVNLYMNEFDQYMKRTVKAKYYIRYADDFVILDQDRSYLRHLIPVIVELLRSELKLSLHPQKVSISTVASGVDFLGWVHFPYHRVLRTTTRRRMLKRIAVDPSDEVIASYLGLLGHGDSFILEEEIYARVQGNRWEA